MKTALLAQNEALEAKTMKPNVQKSMLPLSHSVTYPVDVDGAIYPCCCIEVVPSDSYKISNEVLLRQLQPLLVPQMTRYTLNTAYFYCSNRLGWKKWKMFADQKDKGRDVNYSFELPRVGNCCVANPNLAKISLVDSSADTLQTRVYGKKINYKNSIHTYIDISLNRTLASDADVTTFEDLSDELPLAFPFFDYQIICRDFYTNVDRIPDGKQTWSSGGTVEEYAQKYLDFSDTFSDWKFTNIYPIDDDEIKLKDGAQFISGTRNSVEDGSSYFRGFVLDKMRYHDLRYDYFTSSKRAPMRGEAPTIDTSIATSTVDASNAMVPVTGTLESSVDALPIGVATEGSYKNKLGVTTELVASSSVTANINTSTTAQARLKTALENLKVNTQVSTSITAAQLMLLTSLTLWKTVNMLHKPYYNEFLNAHFDGVKVGDSLAEKPMYIGGTSQTIDINEVLQTSASTDSSKLGTTAAVAHSLSGSYVGSFFAQDFGFIIGVCYILPDLCYDPALPRWASRRSIEDYYFPEFANLSMQATLNKELFFSNDNDWNNQPLGYVGAYDELRSIPNYCAGDLVNPAYTDLKPWILRHSMSNDNKPAINQNFLTAKGNVDMSAWTAPNEPKFMLQVANIVEAMRPMPWLAVPKLTQ